METAIVSKDPYLTQEPAGNRWEPVAGTEHGTLLPRNNRKFIGTDCFPPGVFDLGTRYLLLSLSHENFSFLIYQYRQHLY